MSRPNQPRTIGAESAVAERMRKARESFGWSYGRMAAEMTEQGCPINASALWKIDNVTPPRRITVDEMAAFEAAVSAHVARIGQEWDR